MEIVKWYNKEECKAAIDVFVKKYDDENLTVNDTETFFNALFGTIFGSQEEEDDDDEDKLEMWENLEEDIMQFQSLAYFIEIRDTDYNFVFKLTPEKQEIGLYKGDYEPFKDFKHNIWMDWTPACQEKIMGGDPNTDAEFFSGDCTVKGSTRLASMPRSWIYDMFLFMDREVE